MVMRMTKTSGYAYNAFGSSNNFFWMGQNSTGTVTVKAPVKQASPFGRAKIGAAVTKAITIKKDPTPYVAPVEPWAFRTGEFTNCCGAHILHGFPTDPTPKAIAQVDKYLETFSTRLRTGMTVAMLAEYQAPFRDTLLKNGWQSTGRFVNPVHASKCEGFTYNHNPVKD